MFQLEIISPFLLRLSEVASRELKPNKFCREKSANNIVLGVPVQDNSKHAAVAHLAITAASGQQQQQQQQLHCKSLQIQQQSSVNHCNSTAATTVGGRTTTFPVVVPSSSSSNNSCMNGGKQQQQLSIASWAKTSNSCTAAATTTATNLPAATPMDISDEGGEVVVSQRLQWEQERLATHQEELTHAVVLTTTSSSSRTTANNNNNNSIKIEADDDDDNDQPLDMSKTSRTISHRRGATADQHQGGAGGPEDHAQLFSGLYLLVDTAMGILEQQQANHNIHCNPVVA